MAKDKRYNKLETYNLDKIDRLVTIALIADQTEIFVPKRIVKLAKQYLKAEKLYDTIKVKTK